MVKVDPDNRYFRIGYAMGYKMNFGPGPSDPVNAEHFKAGFAAGERIRKAASTEKAKFNKGLTKLGKRPPERTVDGA